jgi:hypothetical protein
MLIYHCPARRAIAVIKQPLSYPQSSVRDFISNPALDWSHFPAGIRLRDATSQKTVIFKTVGKFSPKGALCIVPFTVWCYGSKIKENEVVGACSTRRGNQEHMGCTILVGKRERNGLLARRKYLCWYSNKMDLQEQNVGSLLIMC